MLVQPENSTDVDIISVLSGGSAASKASDASNEVSASSSLDIISYDSSMDRIRKDVWGKVREAKRKVGKKCKLTESEINHNDTFFFIPYTATTSEERNEREIRF